MAVAATGFFDGVHLGHRAVIETLLQTARERGEQSLILTFWPHPRTVLRGGSRELRLLTSLEEKRELLRGLGVDRIEVLPFTRDFAALSAAQYLDLLRREYDVTSIVLGYDNRFGSDGLSTERIAQLMDSVIVPSADDISSTKIRKALSAGEVGRAGAMLGYEYFLSGVVVSGNMMGRTIGFPTANMKLREPLKCLPGAGAYLSRVEVEGRQLWGMTNIDHKEKIETNIFDFDEEIYGLDLKVTFVAKLRDEIHFRSFDELKSQLEKDREQAKSLL
ncbi:MAG: riboflavin biosynthesis protein RibF [Bacteroidales bacterium]|nr:riboflavin biosynthesis protein RibF [Bacteroidales bacterium]